MIRCNFDKAARDVNPFWDQIHLAALQHSFKDIKLKLSDGTSLGITPAILKRKLKYYYNDL